MKKQAGGLLPAFLHINCLLIRKLAVSHNPVKTAGQQIRYRHILRLVQLGFQHRFDVFHGRFKITVRTAQRFADHAVNQIQFLQAFGGNTQGLREVESGRYAQYR